MTEGFFVTGTDTGVGKTLVSAALIHLLAKRYERVVGMKPVASGCRQTEQGLRNDDAEILLAASTIEPEYSNVNPYAFEPAIAPHLAAKEAGIKIELQTLLDHFEIWSRDNWEQENTALEKDLQKEAVRDEITKLGL